MRRLRIKAAHQPFVLSGNRLRIGSMQYGVGSEIEDDDEGSMEHLLSLMDGSRDRAAIVRDFVSSRQGWDAASVEATVEEFISQGFVEYADAPLPRELSTEEAGRYSRARDFYSWVDTHPRSSPWEVQRRLKQARVGLLGLGGTGSAVAAALVSGGIGELVCADFDVVEESNLTRQLLFDEGDVGRPKVGRAVRKLTAMNRFAKVVGHEIRVERPSDVVELMSGCDAFVLCADQPRDEIQSWTNAAALQTNTPWFIALYAGPMAVVGSFQPGETGCYECIGLHEDARPDSPADARYFMEADVPNAVVAANANVSGHLCALEVTYHLGGLRRQVPGRVFHFNFSSWDHQYFIDVSRHPDCPACGERGRGHAPTQRRP